MATESAPDRLVEHLLRTLTEQFGAHSSSVWRRDEAKGMIERELTALRRRRHKLPDRVEVGTMVEVPSLLFQLDALVSRVDFLSVGSNDLLLHSSDFPHRHAHTGSQLLEVAGPELAQRILWDNAARHYGLGSRFPVPV